MTLHHETEVLSGPRGPVALIIEWARAFQGRRIVASLARLDDRMLRDIGLTRDDLRDAAAVSALHDPARILFARAAERRAARQPQRRRVGVPYY